MAHEHIIQRLPEPSKLERRLQSLAVLTGILSWNLGEPAVSFDSRWQKRARRAIIDNYQGDRVYIVFCCSGALLEGSVHDCQLARDTARAKALRESVPDSFRSFVDNELIEEARVTFNGWCSAGSVEWSSLPLVTTCRDDLDGAESVLAIVEGEAESFQEWAEENYEQDIDLELVEQIFSHSPLIESLIRRLNPSVSLKQVEAEASRIGYPISQ